MYGAGYFIGQIFFGIASLMTLICCNLVVENWPFHVVLMIANFGYLFNLCAQGLSTLTAFIVTFNLSNSASRSSRIPPQTSDTNLARKTWVNVISFVCILGFPLGMTIQHAFEGPSGLARFRQKHGALFGGTCSFLPTATTLYFLLIPATALLLIQLLLICVALRRLETEVSLEKGLKCQQRLMAALKTCLGQLLTWTMALVAIISSSSAVWHIFALCMAMQSIFSSTVCILSRPVIGAALANRHVSSGSSGERMIVHKYEDEEEEEREGDGGRKRRLEVDPGIRMWQYKLVDGDDRFTY